MTRLTPAQLAILAKTGDSDMQAACAELVERRNADLSDTVRDMRAGFELAEEYAKIFEHDGWVRVGPFIDWDYARKKFDEAIAALSPLPCPTCGYVASVPCRHTVMP